MITCDIEIKKFLFSFRLFLYLLIEKRQCYDRRYWISSKLADTSRSIEMTYIVFIIFLWWNWYLLSSVGLIIILYFSMVRLSNSKICVFMFKFYRVKNLMSFWNWVCRDRRGSSRSVMNLKYRVWTILDFTDVWNFWLQIL